MANEALKRTDLDRLYRETDNIATRKREASNEWVLSGAHSVSDKPLLANDPHLALGFPGTWYLARLVGPGFDIRGATSPGSPAVVLGHNGTIGWGFTTTNLDSQDLFIERVDPTDPNRYITPDGARPFARARGDDQRALGRAGHHARARDAARPGDRRLHPPHRRSHAPRAMSSRCRRRRSTAPTPRPRASAASAWRRTGKTSWLPRAASSRRCRTWSMPTPRVTSA